MDRITEATNAAFRKVLGPFSDLSDDSPDPDLHDRLTRLQALHKGLAAFHADCVAQGSGYWPKAMRERAKAAMRLHSDAVKCIRRRIDRLVRKGVL